MKGKIMENIETPNKGMRDFMPSEESLEGAEPTTEETAEVSEVEEAPEFVDGGEDSPVEPQEIEKTAEQTFAATFDPTKLTPELQVAYKQMQGDYTKKTQELAGVRKFHETYSKYEPLLDYIAKNPQLAESYIQNQQQGQPAQPEEATVEYSDNPVEFAKQVKEQAKAEAMKEMMEVYNQDKQRQQYVERVNADISEAEKIDPRLNSDTEFADRVLAEVLADKDVQQGNKSYTQATRESIVKIDGFVKKRVEAEKLKLTNIAKLKKAPVGYSSPANTVRTETQPKTMRDAAAEFLK